MRASPWAYGVMCGSRQHIEGFARRASRARCRQNVGPRHRTTQDAAAYPLAVPLGQVRYAESEGVAVAYAVYGDGPVNVVMFPGLFAHLELNEELPYYRPFVERVPEFGRLVMFDRRGSGLSDRSQFGTAEERMDDLRAVMDDLDLERAAVIGTADGGALAALFAATYPDRVSSLVLHEAVFGPGWGNTVSDEALDALSVEWGTGMFLGMLFEGCLPNDDNQATAARWERNIAWPSQFRQLMAQSARTDVRSALPLVTAPTLLVHNSGDASMPIDSAREAATAIPGARLVELPFDCHCSWDAKTIHAAIDVIEPFLTGHTAPRPRAERLLATVLFTDIVDSTRLAQSEGDKQWRRVLDQVDRITETVVTEQSGRLVKSTGDGALAVFDGPGRAVTAALAVGRQLRSLGISSRAGLHAGEVELRGTDVGGVAVHLAARIQEAADRDEVLLSRTVVDLTYGSDLAYEHRGRVELKGFDEPWELYRALE